MYYMGQYTVRGQTVSRDIERKLCAQYSSYNENKYNPMVLKSTCNEKYYKYIYTLYTFQKNSLGVIWSLKKVLSHFPVTFFPFCPNNAFTFERLQFCNILTGNVCKKQNNQIYTYLQHRGKYFQFFWQIIRCPWITCPLCYHSEIVCVTEFSLSKFPAFCTITCSKLSLIQNEALLLSALKTT